LHVWQVMDSPKDSSALVGHWHGTAYHIYHADIDDAQVPRDGPVGCRRGRRLRHHYQNPVGRRNL